MGEIANDMIDGSACELCGCYFVDEDDDFFTHGYPVTCSDCWDTLTTEEKKLHQKTNADTI